MAARGRLARVRDRIGASGLDGLIISARSNVAYLTGFTGSAGTLLVTAGAAALVTDGRYLTQADSELSRAGVDSDVELVESRRAAEIAGGFFGALTRVGFEAGDVSWTEGERYARALNGKLVDAEGIVEAERSVKDAGEIAAIEAAVEIADAALGDVVGSAGPETTEAEFALDLEFSMRRRGASGVSFDSIVAAGERAALPHARPSSTPLGERRSVVVDFGCRYRGYCSDTTRTLFFGEPAPEIARVWEVVAAAHRGARDRVGPGVLAGDVDAAARGIVADAGYRDAFVHPTGHGVGLDIHEAPRIATGSDAVLEVGNVITIEPGIYLPGVGGARLEDMLVVTEDGHRVLQHYPHDPVA